MTTPAPRRAFTPAEQLDAFVQAVKPALDPVATYHHGPMGGHEWRWSTPAGAWALHVGGAIDAGPLVIGPGGNHWHTTEYALQHADLVLLMLQLAGALEGPDRPVVDVRPVVGQIRGQRWQAPPSGVGPGIEIAGSDLPARGAAADPLQPGTKPLQLHDHGYRPVSVRLVDTGDEVDVVPVGVAFALPDTAPPGVYHLAGHVEGKWVQYALSMMPGAPLTFTGVDAGAVAALEGARPFSLRDLSDRDEGPADRPASRRPGANTGARPGPQFGATRHTLAGPVYPAPWPGTDESVGPVE